MMTQPFLSKIRPFASRFVTVALLGCTSAAMSWLSFTQPAAAHHAMGGGLPTNAWEGFLSGLAHPVIGLDHLAFVIAIGLLSAKQVRGMLIPAFFVGAAMLGTGIHLQKLDLPFTESVVALSVIAMGLILILGKRLSFVALAGLATIAGLFHGYAYGESIVGAEMTPLVAYLAGFTVIQYAITLVSYRIGNQLTGESQQTSTFGRSYGIIACAIGAIFLVTSLQS